VSFQIEIGKKFSTIILQVNTHGEVGFLIYYNFNMAAMTSARRSLLSMQQRPPAAY